MLLKLNKYTFLVFALCFFAAAAIIESHLLREHPETHVVDDIENRLHKFELELTQQTQAITSVLTDSAFDGSYFEILRSQTKLIDETGTGYLVYESGKLVYWSDRSVAFYNSVREYRKKEGLIQLPNGYYLVQIRTTGSLQVVGLHIVKYNYEHENKYLHNTFFKEYKIPESFELRPVPTEKSFAIKSADGSYLFSIEPDGEYNCRESQLYFPAFIYFSGLMLLLFYFKLEFFASGASFILRVMALAAALFIVLWVHLIFSFPKVLTHLPIFKPEVFALNIWLPSLGDYFLVSLFFTFWLYLFTVEIDFPKLQTDSGLPKKGILALLFLFSATLFLLANYLIEILIYNSTISFTLNKIIGISTESILGIVSVGLILFAVLYFLVNITSEACREFSIGRFLALTGSTAIVLGFLQWMAVGKVAVQALLLFFVASLVAAVFSKNQMKKLSLSYLIVFVSLASVYSLIIFYGTIEKKDIERQKLFAITLTAERDPAAEEFLGKIERQLKSDKAIPSLLLQKEDLREYIERTYFSGYFKKYIFEMYVCGPVDSLILQPDNQTYPCDLLMEAMIQDMGVNITGTSFYFMDNMNGRISYTGKLHFEMPGTTGGVNIYIDLDSDLLFEGIGFPELLIDKSITRSENYRKFNFAKYYGGELTDKLGDYNYNFYIDSYEPEDKEFTLKRRDGFEHLIYHTRENNFIIVSRELTTFTDYLISFPYLFVLYFLILIVLFVVINRRVFPQKVVFNLKLKIQAAIISIVFVSLLLVALATIFYNVREYRLKHRNDLNEKMKSIAEEIDMRLEDKDEITPELVDWLNRELAKLSNIFQTDINIYGIDGDLLASSRIEIFQRGLVSMHINSAAFYEIFQNAQYNNFFQPENIGYLSYLSVYKPIINNRGDNLGAINLPYFISQDKYNQEITTFIVAFINLYVLLLLVSIVLAIFIANQITHPLVVIQEKLKKMELGKYNEPIYYRRNDEIGSLVKEYNKKVNELAISADLLARSERESAWREMAKQIAHEIKNPLTPMKLNIQHLQHARGRGKEYNEYIERVTAILIEQIDNLSNIATEFSNFAQIPTARNQVFNLGNQLERVIGLFETHDRITIRFNSTGKGPVMVNADREQFSRAIINLIKNGIQSIPENRDGEINISLSHNDDAALIAVSDNGTGIPVDLREKLFSPSFTTKTSGMGLGLAIVKNIAENFSGKVWFETELEVGTTFFLEIPLNKTTENES